MDQQSVETPVHTSVNAARKSACATNPQQSAALRSGDGRAHGRSGRHRALREVLAGFRDDSHIGAEPGSPEKVFDAYYKLFDPAAQIQSYVEQVMLGHVPGMTLDEVFASQSRYGAVRLRNGECPCD